MNLYFKFCGLETTKTLSGAGRAVLFFKALRRFINAGKRFDGQRKLNGMPNGGYCFEDKRRTRPWLDFLRTTVPTGFCPDSKTITGGFGKDTHRFPTNDTEPQLSKIKHSNRGYAPLSEAPESKPSRSSIAEISEKFRGLYHPFKATLSMHVDRTDATARKGNSSARYTPQTFTMLLFGRHLSVLTLIRHRFEPFTTNPQSSFKPSTALCAVSQ